ncbi:hypothetical protein LOC68_24915 [Blastopirellula sp. JC732]|uniref:Squalene cyclase C-terminal domain-containing protein n=1 Tax=Blastopirellula sediminis TaxID=2894196 RepID=A0A9X1MSF2_9BACT|nr:hypothetical protein [Blastopirellula sediminis]MCC9605048.1 hypothetical protein [Blastopirellula sediminis]MCC9631652.1 hypothetical protein [Blastopirellula sediminis]
MSDTKRPRKSNRGETNSWEERSWPVYGSLALLAGYYGAVSLALFDWDHPQWYFNAKFYMALAPLMLLLGLGLVKFSEQRSIRRGIQLSIILSLILHLSLFVGMVALDLVSVPQGEDAAASRRQARRDPVILPDYHPSQWDSTSDTEHDYERPVEAEEAKPDQKELERKQIDPQQPSRENQPTVDPEMERQATPNTPTKVARQEQAPAETLEQMPSKLSRNSVEMEKRELQPEQIEVQRQSDPQQPQTSAAVAEMSRQQNSTTQSRQESQVEAAASTAAQMNRRDTSQQQPQLAASSAPLQRQSAEPTLSSSAQALAVQRMTDQQVAPSAQQTSSARSSAAQAASSPQQSQVASANSAAALQRSAMTRAESATSTANQIAPASAAQIAKASSAPSSPAASLFAEQLDYAAEAGSRNPSQLSSASTSIGRSSAGAGAGDDSAAGEMLGGVELGVVRIASNGSLRRASSDGAPSLQSALTGGGQSGGMSGRSGGGLTPGASASLEGEVAGAGMRSNNGSGNADGPQLASGSNGGMTEIGRQQASGVPGGSSMGSADGVTGGLGTSGLTGGAIGSRAGSGESGSGESLAATASSGGSAFGRSGGSGSGPSTVMIAGDAPGMGGDSIRRTPTGGGLAGGSLAPGSAGPSIERRGAGISSIVKANAAEGAGGLGDRMSPVVGTVARRQSNDTPQLAINMTQFPVRASRSGLPQISSAIAMPTEAFRRRMMREEEGGEGADGPSPEVREAIERGLAFLARHQMPNGSWSLKNFPLTQPDHAAAYSHERSKMDSDTAATGLALLAFMGAGYHHLDDKYQNEVRKGLNFLIENQQENGDLYVRMDEASNSNAWLYSHGIASIALCEAYGMTQDANLRDPSQKAINFITASQDKTVGAWRYLPEVGGDTSVSGWMTMALKSGQLAGLDTSPQTFSGINRWLSRAAYQPEGGALFVYNPDAVNDEKQRHGRYPSKTMTAVGLLMRLYMGSNRDTEVMQKGAEHLLANLPENGSRTSPQRDTYYWYYATQVMFHMKGEYWQAWNNRLEPMLVESQVVDGPLNGSWEPEGDIPDRWGAYAGRIYVTTMNLLSLEVHHRHLPLYEDAAK